MTWLLRCILAVSFGGCLAVSAQGDDWGTLRGRFVVEGVVPPPAVMVGPAGAVVNQSVLVSPSGELKNALIMLRTKNVAVAPRYAATEHDEVTLEIKNRNFQPRVATMRTSQTLMLSNADAFNYNPSLSPLLNPPLVVPLKVGQSVRTLLPREEPLPIAVSDNVVPWLQGWVVVRDDPYAAASAGDGKFSLSDLPAGVPLQFRLWHEKCGYLKHTSFQGGATDAKGSFKITIQPGQNDLGDIVVTAKSLQ